MVAAFFQEHAPGDPRLDLTRRAKPIADSIRLHTVQAWAPEALLFEFLKAAHRKCRSRERVAEVGAEVAGRQFRSFLELPFVWVPHGQLAERAWTLAMGEELSPTDAWFLACAEHADAELWIATAQSDRFSVVAEARWTRTHVLAREQFQN